MFHSVACRILTISDFKRFFVVSDFPKTFSLLIGLFHSVLSIPVFTVIEYSKKNEIFNMVHKKTASSDSEMSCSQIQYSLTRNELLSNY